jgi:hypothetical protein
MQMWRSTSTMPSARLNEAPVGQTSTQGGSAQCWHIIGAVAPAGRRSFSSPCGSTARRGGFFGRAGRSPCCRPATQASQPLAQRVVSISRPQRTFAAGVPGQDRAHRVRRSWLRRTLDQADAGGDRRARERRRGGAEEAASASPLDASRSPAAGDRASPAGRVGWWHWKQSSFTAAYRVAALAEG